MKKIGHGRGLRPISVLPLGFGGIILLGAFLLTLPAASAAGEPLSFADALFTATSATCVTGLIVVDTGTFFSPFGQAVVLCLIQIGGLGFMALATILFSLLGRRISLKERMTLAESYGESRLQGVVRLGRSAVILTFGFELLGAALLALRFVPALGWKRGLWFSVFHSISAFCNAGFDLIGHFRSFTGYTDDPLVCFTLMGLIVIGGIGFAALLNIGSARRFTRFRLHTKIVLLGTGLLLAGGAILTFLLERGNPATLGGMPLGEQAMASLFQSVTLRTAGFNTIDQLAMCDASKLIGAVFMLVGGAPAGTAGGLKLTTFAVMLLTVRAQSLGKRDVEAFGRRLSPDKIRNALCVLTIGIAALFTAVAAMSVLESGTEAGKLGFLNLLYEAASALCTVGVSVGFTAVCGPVSRIILILMMFAGRVGLLTLALTLAGKRDAPLVRLPEEDILIG